MDFGPLTDEEERENLKSVADSLRRVVKLLRNFKELERKSADGCVAIDDILQNMVVLHDIESDQCNIFSYIWPLVESNYFAYPENEKYQKIRRTGDIDEYIQVLTDNIISMGV